MILNVERDNVNKIEKYFLLTIVIIIMMFELLIIGMTIASLFLIDYLSPSQLRFIGYLSMAFFTVIITCIIIYKY